MGEFIYNRELDYASLEHIVEMQEKLLKQHMLHCKDNSPFYRKLLSDVDLSGNSFDILKTLPFTDKSQLNSSPQSFTAVPENDIRDIVFSSGTTGNPLPVPYTENDLKRLTYNEYKSFLACGMLPSDRVLLTCTLDRCFIAGLAYYEGAKAIGAATIRNGLNTLESHVEIIRRLQPTVIVGVPSFLKRLGMYLEDERLKIDHVRMLICIGEPIRDRQFGLNSLGKLLEKSWSAKVYSTYASSETITSFCDCTAGNGGHLHPDLGVLEIVDEDGNPVPDGEVGEIVMTPLRMEAMPLLRFRTGDMSYITREPCVCGRNSLRLGPVLGRKQQMMKINGTTLYPQTVFTALENIEPVVDYYVIAREGENRMYDYAEVHVALESDAADIESIIRRLAAHIRIKLPMYITDIADVRAKVFSSSNRKPQRFFVLNSDGSEGGADGIQ